MSMTVQTAAKPVAAADRFAPPRAALAMPKQVLTVPSGGLMRAMRNLLWSIAPGLRRLG